MSNQDLRYRSGEIVPRAPDDLFFTTPRYLVIEPANPPRTARRLASFLAAGGRLYERDSQVVKVSSAADGERIEQLDVHDITIEAHDVCQPVIERFSEGRTRYEPVGLPAQIARLYLHLSEERNLPHLKGICAAPLFSDGGEINSNKGYDKATGLWCAGASIPDLPERPSLADAKAALLSLRQSFASIPFDDASRSSDQGNALVDLSTNPGADESALLVGLMTAICRPSLPLAPGLLVRAPQLSGAGTGKGLLVHAIARIAYNRVPRAFSGSGDELTKSIGSALMGSEPLLYADNINSEQLRSNLLAQALTEAAVDMRPLGRSKMVKLNSTSFIVVTGNGIQVTEDLVRRFLIVNLDAKCENPELRLFDQDLEQMITSRRLKLLAAVLTIWRWGRQNALPKGLPLGSFQQWASWCRDPLIALGCVDPVERIAEAKAQDPQRQRLSRLFDLWFASHGATPVKFSELDPRVVSLLNGRNSQARVTDLQTMHNVRADGFVFEIFRPAGRWSTQKYSVRRENA